MKPRLLLAAGCFICVVVGVKSLLDFEDTEFSGGPLFHQNLAVNLLILAMILTIRFPRAASVTALLGAVVSMPVYLYLTFPEPFQHAWGGQWSVLSRVSFDWNWWWVPGLLASLFVMFTSTVQLVRAIRAPLH